jgi:tRNA (guanine-N7-)-methyltransferase
VAVSDALIATELRLDDTLDTLSWSEVFGSDGSVEIDVGCGRGMYVIDAATARPDVNYLGIEVVPKPFYIARERAAKRELGNVRLLKGDAREFFAERVPPESVSVVHVQFPDPWPKKRHHKRRVVTTEFVLNVARVLRADGKLHIATDIADYFDELLVIAEGAGVFRLVSEGSYDATADLVTNFAAKYREQGREMYDAWLELADLDAGAATGDTPF